MNFLTAFFLYSFSFLRPLATTKFFVGTSLGGMKLVELFGIGSSYLALLLIILNLRKQRLDLLMFIILYLCTYVVLSIAWGSSAREIGRLILPFCFFFLARSFVDNDQKLRNIAIFSVLGFLVPAIASSTLIGLGESLWKVNYWTGLPRYEGVYSGPHSLGHNMALCIVFLSIWNYFQVQQPERLLRSNLLFFCLGFVCLFAIFKSYTRTVYVAFACFTGVYLLGRKMYWALAICMLVAVVIVVSSTTFQTIFWDVIQPLTGETEAIGKMGSGRIGGWSFILNQFWAHPLVLQIRGIGITSKATITAGAQFGGSHNDMLAMLVCFGYLGISLYFCIFFVLFARAIRYRKCLWLKGIIIGFFVMVVIANLLSNSYLTRFELGQSFFLLTGSFMGLIDASKDVCSTPPYDDECLGSIN